MMALVRYLFISHTVVSPLKYCKQVDAKLFWVYYLFIYIFLCLLSVSMTVKADLKTSSKIKPPRRTLSDRFCEYEKESKKKKDEEKKESPPTSKETAAKSKPTVFTIQLPSKPPPITDSPPNMPPSVMKNTGKKETKEKPVKVTLVPGSCCLY